MMRRGKFIYYICAHDVFVYIDDEILIVDSSSTYLLIYHMPYLLQYYSRMIKKLYDDDCSNVLDKSWDKTVRKEQSK